MNKPSALSRLLYGLVFVLILGMALGIRWWSDKNAPPVHHIPIRIVEKALPPNAPKFMAGSYEPLPREFIIEWESAPQKSQPLDTYVRQLGRYVEGPAWKWKVERIQYRSSPQQPWTDKASDRLAKRPPVEAETFRYGRGGGPQAGEWKAVLRAEVEFYDPATKEVWRGVARRDIIDRITAADLAEKKRLAALPTPTEAPPAGAIKLIPGKAYIKKIQWSKDGGQTWHDMPQPGRPDFPLSVTLLEVLGLKAVKKYPKQPWPNWPDMMPRWDQDGYWNIGEKNSVQFKRVSRDKTDLQTVTAKCGNQVTVQVYVLPEPP
ncbi:MAG: hypothetical protein M3347_02765 [Armatimonadota bacterium]|nr:hypothetical protein [Armatimonadota bacterium]